MTNEQQSANDLASVSVQTEAAVWTVKEFAKLNKISERHAWRLIDLGKVVGVIRLGRSVRIAKAAYEKFLQNGGGQ